MGTICILLGVIILLGSAFLGLTLTRTYLTSTLPVSLAALPQGTTAYIVIIGVCVFIGLLICLNLVMHGLNSNKLSKLQAQVKRSRRGEH